MQEGREGKEGQEGKEGGQARWREGGRRWRGGEEGSLLTALTANGFEEGG